MDIHRIYGFIGRRFRGRRMALFTKLFTADDRVNVLDLGGSAQTWTYLGAPKAVIVVNLDSLCLRGHQMAAVGNALMSPFQDKAFDVVFSNSLIEHLSTAQNQCVFAAEVRRLSQNGYFIQTPNKWFPIEPHYLAPFIQFVPKRIRPTVVRWMTPWGWITKPSRELCLRTCDEIRLLDAREMKRLFPDADIVRERFLGMTKSLIAIRRSNGNPQAH